ncbi:sigma-70 family RNA polymerase sigma factor [Myceligenerans indicum]|uniref:Sigma-70 family RNA polymerase sigma factor n=1 Tax=Myceligenerans indicum TaxID=2593663 RepID=A0ABS1LRA4_9MICO|nr:sigma-70 family RNA polymerase sigma factor [Myceligenerans indicum]MBL0888816.1 sigma-70 family RNA polymerase sigma factor [Myceligenerans indicum]
MSYRDAGTLEEISDRELVARAREGGSDAMQVLWERHAQAGRAAARRITRSFDSDDLVQEAFTRTLTAIRKGMGPVGPFRPYLYTAIRNIATSWARQADAGDAADFTDGRDVADPAADFSAASLDKAMAVRAFRTLPDEWRTVLWYADVEGMGAREIAPVVGITPGAVASLTYRAREGLRRAWIQAHISDNPVDGDCRRVVEQVPGYLRGSLSQAGADVVRVHVAGCARCGVLVEELGDVAERLRVALLPTVLGAGALGLDASHLLAGTQDVVREAASSVFAKFGGAAAREAATGSGYLGATLSKGAISVLASVGGAAAVVASVVGLWYLTVGEPGRGITSAAAAVVDTAPPRYADVPQPAESPDPIPTSSAASDDPSDAADDLEPDTSTASFARSTEPAEGASVDPDPVGPDPVGPDPVGPDPVGPDPVGPDPVGPDPVGPDLGVPDLGVPDPIGPDLVKQDPDEMDHVDPEPGASSLNVSDVTRDHLLPRVYGSALPDALVEAVTAGGETLGSTRADREGVFVLDLERSSPTSDVLIEQVDGREPRSAPVSIGPVEATGPSLELVGASVMTLTVPEGVEPRNQWVTVALGGPVGAFVEVDVDGAHAGGPHLLTASAVERSLRGLSAGSHELSARFVDHASGRVSETVTAALRIEDCPQKPPSEGCHPQEVLHATITGELK